MAVIIISALTHDFVLKRSTVTLMWDGDPDKSLALPVPFQCSLEAIQVEAEKAVRDLSAEVASIAVIRASDA